MRRVHSHSTGWVLCVAFVLLSCGGTGSGAEEAPGDEAAPDTASTSAEVKARDADDPFYGFDIDRPGAEPTREHLIALRLQNDGADDAVVFVDAGAGEVFLDSVEAGRWSRVDLVTQGPAVTLRTARPSGESIQLLDLSVGPDSVVEVNLGNPPAAP